MKAVKSSDAVFDVSRDDDFGVGLGAEREVRIVTPQAAIVVNFAVEHDHNAVRRIAERLVGTAVLIDDREPAMQQVHRAVIGVPCVLAVRSPPAQPR